MPSLPTLLEFDDRPSAPAGSSRRWRTWTAGCVGALLALVIAAGHGPTAGSIARAQQAEPAAPVAPPAAKSSTGAQKRAAVEKKLDEDVFEVSFVETPLREAVAFFSDRTGVPIRIEDSALEEDGVASDAPVTVELRAGSVSTRTALEMLLERHALISAVREGILVVTTRSREEQFYEVRVYDARDLAGWMGDEERPVMAGGFGGVGGGFFPAAGAGARPAAPLPKRSPLADLIVSMTGAPWKEIDGAGGEVRVYDGTIVVRHAPRVHRQIEELLAKLRASRAGEAP